jgi:hypothetical protein
VYMRVCMHAYVCVCLTLTLLSSACAILALSTCGQIASLCSLAVARSSSYAARSCAHRAS